MAVDEFPPICDFFAVRKKIMRSAMEEIKRLHERGEPVSNKKFGEIIRKKWQEIKEEQKKVCP